MPLEVRLQGCETIAEIKTTSTMAIAAKATSLNAASLHNDGKGSAQCMGVDGYPPIWNCVGGVDPFEVISCKFRGRGRCGCGRRRQRSRAGRRRNEADEDDAIV